MRNYLRKLVPDHQLIRNNRWLKPYSAALLHPRLWHLNRHSAAGAVACGLFCGLIPGPFQMLGAAVAALVFRVNLPLALLTTFYTNPFTIVPLYFLAYEAGRLITGDGAQFFAPPEFDWAHLGDWTVAVLAWVASVGKPLAIGIAFLASALAVAGYFSVRAAWRLHLIRAWRRRQKRRAGAD